MAHNVLSIVEKEKNLTFYCMNFEDELHRVRISNGCILGLYIGYLYSGYIYVLDIGFCQIHPAPTNSGQAPVHTSTAVPYDQAHVIPEFSLAVSLPLEPNQTSDPPLLPVPPLFCWKRQSNIPCVATSLNFIQRAVKPVLCQAHKLESADLMS